MRCKYVDLGFPSDVSVCVLTQPHVQNIYIQIFTNFFKKHLQFFCFLASVIL